MCTHKILVLMSTHFISKSKTLMLRVCVLDSPSRIVLRGFASVSLVLLLSCLIVGFGVEFGHCWCVTPAAEVLRWGHLRLGSTSCRHVDLLLVRVSWLLSVVDAVLLLRFFVFCR